MTVDQLFAELDKAQRRGDVDRSIELLRELLSIAQQNVNPIGEAEMLRRLGNAYQDKEDVQNAHSYRITAARLVQEMGSRCPPELDMAVSGDLGRSFIAVSDWSAAEAPTRRALELAETLKHQQGLGLYRLNLGLVLSQTGRVQEALEMASNVIKDAERLDDQYLLALQHLNLASMHLQQVHLNECQRNARLALAHADRSGNRAVTLRARQILGESYQIGRLLTGRSEYGAEADRYLQQTLEVARTQGNVSLESQTEIELARICEGRGKRAEASAHYRAAVEALEKVRATLGYEEFQLSYFQSWQSSYDRIAEFFLRQGQIDQAFYTSERSRSRLLLALLGQGRSNASAWSGPRRDELHTVLREYGSETIRGVFGNGTRGRSRGTTVGLRGAEHDGHGADDDSPRIRQARTRFLKLQESERQSRAMWQPRQAPPAATLAQVGRSLGDDEALIVYEVTEHSVIVFVVTNRAHHFQHLLYPRETLVRDVEEVCATICEPYDDDALSRLNRVLAKLHALLVAPVLAAVGSSPHWTIVPHGPLHRVPWGALHSRGRYLVEQHSLSLLPSASLGITFRQLEPVSGRDAVFFGDPDPDDLALRLPGAAREVTQSCEAVSAGPPAFLGPDATKEEFLRRAPSARLLHVASHHLFDATAPLLSFLKFAGQDGARFLYAFEVAELTLSAELVSLAACETARSRIATGDEQYGIVRAFLAAGARSVISTLWKIEDESAAALFPDFYVKARDRSLADALVQAQRCLLADRGTAHPYFWAPYLLSGRWDQPLTFLGRSA